MEKRPSVLLAMVVALSLVSLTPAGAKAPLVGDMSLQFNLGWGGPSEVIPEWVGTIVIDEEEYGMAFFNIGLGKPFESNPSGSVLFFDEIWKIYDVDELVFAFDSNGVLTTFVEGDVVLWGYDNGIVTLKNSKYHMNGSVEGAGELFEDWIGRNVHMSGLIEWYLFGAPQYAPGTFRIN